MGQGALRCSSSDSGGGGRGGRGDGLGCGLEFDWWLGSAPSVCICWWGVIWCAHSLGGRTFWERLAARCAALPCAARGLGYIVPGGDQWGKKSIPPQGLDSATLMLVAPCGDLRLVDRCWESGKLLLGTPLQEKGGKQPYYIYLRGEAGREEPMVFAGLWDTWQAEAEGVVHTYTILTTGVWPGGGGCCVCVCVGRG